MKSIIAVAAFLIALTITGTDDYTQAKLAERDACRVNPQPEYCRR